MKELTTNHRQSGDVTWSDRLNLIRPGLGGQQLDDFHALVKTRLGNRSGGAVSESAFKDAMRLYPKNDTIREHNALKLAELAAHGNEKTRLVAGHGQVGQYGPVTTGNISPNDIPKEADNCGGLADVVEVRHCCDTH